MQFVPGIEVLDVDDFRKKDDEVNVPSQFFLSCDLVLVDVRFEPPRQENNVLSKIKRKKHRYHYPKPGDVFANVYLITSHLDQVGDLIVGYFDNEYNIYSCGTGPVMLIGSCTHSVYTLKRCYRFSDAFLFVKDELFYYG